MEEFLRYVIGELVEFPEEVIITKTETPKAVTFHVAMRKSDLGKIIGKGGHTIQAIRSLLGAAAHKRGVRAAIDILE